MLNKRKLAKGKVRVTFSMPTLDGVEQLNVVGDFNNWSITENPLKKAADGSWSVALTLDGDQEYQYRYYAADSNRWYDDDTPDSKKFNEFGGYNGIVSTRLEDKAEATPKAAPKKKASKKKAA